MSPPMPMTIQMPRQPMESRNPSANSVPIGQTQAPPMNCMKAVTRPRIRLGREFGGVGEAERLRRAEADPGDEAAGDRASSHSATAPRGW